MNLKFSFKTWPWFRKKGQKGICYEIRCHHCAFEKWPQNLSKRQWGLICIVAADRRRSICLVRKSLKDDPSNFLVTKIRQFLKERKITTTGIPRQTSLEVLRIANHSVSMNSINASFFSLNLNFHLYLSNFMSSRFIRIRNFSVTNDSYK